MLTFEVERSALAQTRFMERPEPQIGPDQVRLAVDRFAFTANNITYAAFGEMLGYWRFFPTDDGWGVVPVWGFADVVESRHDGIGVGERFYGYYPMSTDLIVEPTRLSSTGFVDGAPHRAELPAVYNRYARTDADPAYRPELEAQQMLFRPLFMTSFLIDDMLAESEFFGAERVLLTSASSKTAFSLAFLLQHGAGRGVEVVGLTSERNREFVSGLGCFDRVHTYDALGELESGQAGAAVDTVLVDFAGNAELRHRVHAALGDGLRYSCSVGASHWDRAGGVADDLPGPRPVLFFAPDRVKLRISDWGPGGFEARVAGAWGDFVSATSAWLAIREDSGRAAVERVYLEALAGRIPANVGQILAWRPV